MADISHCQPNQLVRRAWMWRWGSLAFIIPISVGLGSLLAPIAAIAAIPLWLVCRRAGGLAYAGAAGEVAAMNILKNLPADHIVFNQVRMPCAAAREGFLEADYVVVAPNRVVVVEVKHNYGEIIASVKSASWNVSRYSKTVTMRSPALQVSRHVAALGSWLRAKGAPGVWVEPAVFFSNPNSSYLHNKQSAASNVSLIGPGELLDYFSFCQPTDRPVNQKAVVLALEALRSWEADRAEGKITKPAIPKKHPSRINEPRPSAASQTVEATNIRDFTASNSDANISTPRKNRLR